MASWGAEFTLKRKGAPSSDSPTPPRPRPSTKYFSSEFKKDQNRTRYETNIIDRSIISSRRVDFSSFRSLRIEELFMRIGLSELCNLGGPSYDRLVRLFYANLSSKPCPLVVKSYILGHKIKLNPRIVNQVIGFSTEEPCEEYYQVNQEPEFVLQGEGLDFLRKIHRNPEVDVFYKPKGKDLNVKARVIHHVISRTLLPRDGHKDLVNWMDLYLMEKIYNGKRFNPGYIILNHMSEIVNKGIKNLPYNTLIQRIIEHFLIAVPYDEPARKEKVVDVFDHFTLGRMGIVEVEGEWVFKADNVDSISAAAPPLASTTDDIPKEEDAPSQPSPPLHWSSSLSTIEEKLDIICFCLCNLTSTVERLTQQVQDLSSAQTCFQANMLAEFKKFMADVEEDPTFTYKPRLKADPR